VAKYLFVYGTLRHEISPAELKELLGVVRSVSKGSVPGKLYDLGDYPGAILDPNSESRIIGEVLKLPDDDRFLADLDTYEGFDQEDRDSSLFNRLKREVELDDGRKLECWLYIYNGQTSLATIISHGDYLMTMEARAKVKEPTESSLTLSHIQQLESQYLMQTYARSPVLFVRGKGSMLYDDQGKAYLDFISGIGVNVLGYDHPRVRRVMKEQGNLLHTSNLYYHPYQGQLAERLVKASGMARVFFCNTGTESVEGSLKLARAWQRKQGREDKTEFVALVNSFHGRTMGALSITEQEKYRKPFEPLIPGVRFIDPDNSQNGFAEVREAINDRTAAVIIETIQGESGVRPVNDSFLKAVREACDAVDALLILDEVQCGLGRTGKTFAFENTPVKPDVLCVAKPLGLGVPLGAFIVAEKAVDGLKAGDHGSTFGGGPLACRLSLEFMEMLQEEQLMQRVTEVGNYFRKQLRRLHRRHPELIKDVRGLGLMVGAETSFPSKSVAMKMLERGFLINCTHDTVLRFLPPYIIKKSEISSMLTNLEEVIVEEGGEKE
jgi:acetylornithine aminotransferase/acetylornithine/N-succinyldiaminopimelate aminotransferase